MAEKNQWLEWLKSNLLELLILILVLVLLVKVYSAPIAAEVSSVEGTAVEEPLAEEAAPEPLTGGVTTEETSGEAEQPLEEEATTEPAAEETPTE